MHTLTGVPAIFKSRTMHALSLRLTPNYGLAKILFVFAEYRLHHVFMQDGAEVDVVFADKDAAFANDGVGVFKLHGG